MIAFSEEAAVNEIMRLLHVRGIERDEDEIADAVHEWHRTNRTTKHIQHAYEETLRLLRKHKRSRCESIFPKLED